MGESTHRDSAFDSIDLDLDNPDIGSPSRPAALDVTESIPPRPAAEPVSFNTTTLKMPLVANEAGSAPIDQSRRAAALRSLRHLARPRSAGDGWPRIPARRPGGLNDGGDPLSRKLELAEEFQRIGDKDGARDLLREVLATASGATKTKAQGMLDRIS